MQIALSTALPMLQFPKHIILFFSCFIISFEAFAQEKYRAVNWGVNDGLSMAGKNYVLKDARGFLWVSSISGINRFDGKSFKNYFGEKNKPGALLGGFTAFPLIEDSIHNIWIGTNDGLSRYDIIADTFSNFKLYPDSYQELRHSYPFQATKNEVYAIHIYSKTIYTFNIHTLAKRALIKLVPTDTVDFGNKVEPGIIYDEKSNSLWMLQGGVDKPGGGLLQISLSTGKREHYKWPCFKKIADHPHFSQGMCFDQKRRCLWLNTRDGLMQFKLDDKQFHHIDAFNEWVKLKDYNFPGAVGGITLDQQNRVWVSTNPKGIIIYDPATQLASFPFMDQNLEKDVSSGNCSIYCDRDGLIWSSSI
ncbi:MAG: ligand-binding sensor domain-containing protein [Flavisolibacter sp.]